MNNIFSKAALGAIIVFFSASILYATPIYMQYEGISGSVTAQQEVKNGKVTIKDLKPGTYSIKMIYTGPDALGADGSPKTQAHVKTFTGQLKPTQASGGAGKASFQDIHISITTQDGKTTTARAAGKMTMNDIHFMVAPGRSQGSVSGVLGTLVIDKKNDDSGKPAQDTTKKSTGRGRDSWSDMFDFVVVTL